MTKDKIVGNSEHGEVLTSSKFSQGLTSLRFGLSSTRDKISPHPSSRAKRKSRGGRETSTHIRLSIMEQAAESEHMDNLLQLKGGKLFRAFVILFCFFGFGIGFYSFWEEMQPYEALYFTILTISTVGYGDVTPETDHGKLFTCVFVFAGLALLAEAMSIIADYLIERMNRMSRKVAEEAAARQKEEAARRANEEKIKCRDQASA